MIDAAISTCHACMCVYHWEPTVSLIGGAAICHSVCTVRDANAHSLVYWLMALPLPVSVSIYVSHLLLRVSMFGYQFSFIADRLSRSKDVMSSYRVELRQVLKEVGKGTFAEYDGRGKAHKSPPHSKFTLLNI